MQAVVQELDQQIQQLSVADQLWLMEKLTQHIREQIDISAAPAGIQNVESDADTWQLNPDSPLYEDMQEILKKKKEGSLKFYSYEDVFGE